MVLFGNHIFRLLLKHFENWMCARVKASFICKYLINLHISFGCVNVYSNSTYGTCERNVWLCVCTEAFQKDFNRQLLLFILSKILEKTQPERRDSWANSRKKRYYYVYAPNTWAFTKYEQIVYVCVKESEHERERDKMVSGLFGSWNDFRYKFYLFNLKPQTCIYGIKIETETIRIYNMKTW